MISKLSKMCSSLILYVNILCGHTAWANVNGSRWVHCEKIIVVKKKSEENSLNLTEMSFFFFGEILFLFARSAVSMTFYCPKWKSSS